MFHRSPLQLCVSLQQCENSTMNILKVSSTCHHTHSLACADCDGAERGAQEAQDAPQRSSCKGNAAVEQGGCADRPDGQQREERKERHLKREWIDHTLCESSVRGV